ncbi:MAG: hypothetical protein ACOCUR_02460, partial [Nanoarchaeota archaeon]
SKYKINDEEIDTLKKKLNCSSSDGFVLVLAGDDTAKTALDYVILRSDYAAKFIPKEVRKTNPDGTTSFMRPMPGSARMYPETDCVPILTLPLLSEISLPELIEDRSKRYQKDHGISKDFADGLSKFDFSLIGEHDFDSLVKKFKNLSPSFIAQCLLGSPKEVKTRFGVDFQDDNYKEVLLLLDKVNNSEISKDTFVDLLSRLIKKEVIDYKEFKPEDDGLVEKKIKEIVDKNKSVSFGGLMGMCMKEFKGKVDGKKISQILSKYAKK